MVERPKNPRNTENPDNPENPVEELKSSCPWQIDLEILTDGIVNNDYEFAMNEVET